METHAAAQVKAKAAGKSLDQRDFEALIMAIHT